MRAFIIACVAALVIAIAAVASLGLVQRSSAAAFTTDATRINPSWTLRPPAAQAPTRGASPGAAASGMHEECSAMTMWQMIRGDLGMSRPAGCSE